MIRYHSQLLSIPSYLLNSPCTVSLSTLVEIFLLTGFPLYSITLNSCRYLLTYLVSLVQYHSQLLAISSYLLVFPGTVSLSTLGDIFLLTGFLLYSITLNSWRYLLTYWISLIRYHSQLLSISSYLLDSPCTVSLSTLVDIFLLTGFLLYSITLNSWRYWISLIRYHSQLLSISSYLLDSPCTVSLYLLTYWISLIRYHSQLLSICSYLLDSPCTASLTTLGDIFLLTGFP